MILPYLVWAFLKGFNNSYQVKITRENLIIYYRDYFKKDGGGLEGFIRINFYF
jgi:hypothetical protein